MYIFVHSINMLIKANIYEYDYQGEHFMNIILKFFEANII